MIYCPICEFPFLSASQDDVHTCPYCGLTFKIDDADAERDDIYEPEYA